MRRKWIGGVICVILLTCLVCPFVETALHSHGSLLNGHDSASIMAVLALCIALSLAAASVVWIYCAGSRRETRHLLDLYRLNCDGYFPSIEADLSPPLTLRI